DGNFDFRHNKFLRIYNFLCNRILPHRSAVFNIFLPEKSKKCLTYRERGYILLSLKAMMGTKISRTEFKRAAVCCEAVPDVIFELTPEPARRKETTKRVRPPRVRRQALTGVSENIFLFIPARFSGRFFILKTAQKSSNRLSEGYDR
ncbi:MAG: hypothetical protein KBS44_07665, partial [Clostridiales bacterium]|nr:hypothetical protein [Candidatus Coliplasma equi]